MKEHIVPYYRVSTRKQGNSGLGLEAQKRAVQEYASRVGARVIREFTEIESGKYDNRPQLKEALDLCELTGARLVIARLDRLSRNLAFIASMQQSGVRFTCCDMPEANETMVSFMAVMAEAERKAISERTRQALSAAKARGVKLGGPKLEKARDAALRRGAPGKARAAQTASATARHRIIRRVLEQAFPGGGRTLKTYAEYLNGLDIKTRRGSDWTPTAVRRAILKS